MFQFLTKSQNDPVRVHICSSVDTKGVEREPGGKKPSLHGKVKLTATVAQKNKAHIVVSLLTEGASESPMTSSLRRRYQLSWLSRAVFVLLCTQPCVAERKAGDPLKPAWNNPPKKRGGAGGGGVTNKTHNSSQHPAANNDEKRAGERELSSNYKGFMYFL